MRFLFNWLWRLKAKRCWYALSPVVPMGGRRLEWSWPCVCIAGMPATRYREFQAIVSRIFWRRRPRLWAT